MICTITHVPHVHLKSSSNQRRGNKILRHQSPNHRQVLVSADAQTVLRDAWYLTEVCARASMRTDVLSITLTHALSFSLSLFFTSLGTQHPTTHSLLAHCTTWRRNIRQDSIHHGVRSTFPHLTFSPTPPDPQF